MKHTDWKPAWVRGNKLEDIVWIGKDTLAWCTGVHVIFFNIVQRKKSIYWCWNNETGEGARCLSAHSKLSVLAFSERIVQPKILVFAYPSMTKISECTGGCVSGYITTAFTAGDYLVSIDSYPLFVMTVWKWRTGEKVITVDTSIRDEVGQILRITQIGPNVAAQLGKTCGKLYTWELDIAGSVAILKGKNLILPFKFTCHFRINCFNIQILDHEVKLPKDEPIVWVDWSPTSTEPLLALTDTEGHIYLSNFDGSDIYRIVYTQRCGICTNIEVPRVAWFRDGIVLRTTFCQIRFFKRNPRTNEWRREWYVKSETRPHFLVTHPFGNQCLFYYTLEGYLMQIEFADDADNPKVVRYLDYGATYRFADFVYPWCHHLVVMCDAKKELIVLESYEGTPVASIDPEIESEVSYQASHPDFPLVILATEQGELVFTTLAEPGDPKIVARLRLQRTPIDLIKFSNSGRFMIAAEKRTGDCYCVGLQRDKMYSVKALIKVRRPVVDVLIFEGHKKLRVLALFVGIKQYFVGQRLLLYEVSEEQNLVTESIYTLNLPGVYRALWHVPGNPMSLIGSPYLTRQLRVQRVQDFRNVVIEDGLLTGHQVKLANLFVDRSWISTTALDGLVLIRDKTIRRVMGHIMTHHRSDWGTTKAVANRQGDLIVCLGYNGSLIATKTAVSDKKQETPQSESISPKETPRIYKVEHGFYEKVKKKINSDYANLDPTIYEVLMNPKYELPDTKEGDKTWSDWRDEMQLREEEEKCREERTAILADFEVLRSKVKKLLDANEASPEIEKLPVSAFDLDIAGRDQKLKAGRDVCESLHLEMEHNIFEMKRVSRWIRETFWDSQEVQGKSLFAILGTTEVTNYPSVAEDPYEKDHLKWAIFCTTTHRYIEQSNLYPQVGYYGFNQMMINNRILMHDCSNLRAFFNRSFDEVYSTKEREMQVIRKRIEKIHYIDSELRTMFNSSVSYVPAYPEWHWQERTESIIKVQDHEVKAKPYVSPSQQELLDKQAAEEERIRQLLLADDFRERALMAMMDGVLEVRWEDTIKIDVPKPACMLEKKPEDYTEDDILAVKQYEKDVNFLLEERERYRRMLEAEYGRVMELLREGIDKFNGKLDELFRVNIQLQVLQLKLNIEAAINQLYLRYIRGWVLIRKRFLSLQEEDRLKKRITEKEQAQEVLTKHLETFHNVYEEMIAKQTSLVSKEKTIAKKFKSEFASLNKFQTELLERQYYRRPRIHLKHLGASDLHDLAVHVISRRFCVYSPFECKEYLRILNHLDVRPVTLPLTIETHHWEDLVRLRRNKIEIDLKILGNQAEIAYLDNVIMGFEQKIEKCKTDVENMKKSLIEMRERRTMEELDVEIQLVLKMGQVEINLDSHSNDTNDAILISKTDIDSVNQLIKAAGACKLKALSRLLSFQRGTLMMQWNHECQKNRLEDLQEDLRFTESVIVTKEMQLFLKRKAKGLADDKTPQQLDDDIAAVERQFSRLLEDEQARLQSIQKEIACVRRKNEQLDRQILEMNVARCEMEQRRDLIAEARQQEHMERKLRMVMRRSELIKKLQDNYAELIELQTEHELLRLRRYPTFHFTMLDDNHEGKQKDEPTKCPC
ncbi:WD repeat-containing protein 96 [Eufriesea mexicana]|uniref:Cilia- and flagella-associated protein 43 n=1 Tax=Eufriesea mexicana TaxID=516756 RepID=A0A310SPU9_9HYME|nr:WD repeat-containing protein 96 [Eufriesea mexicana]